MDLSAVEKVSIIEDEYDISDKGEIGKEAGVMCNLSQGVLEKGIVQGRNEMIIKMHKNGIPMEQIAQVAELSVEEVKNVIASIQA